MKKSFFYVFGLCISLLFVTSCGKNLSKVSTDAEGFATIQKELVSKFGEKACYDQISIVNAPADRAGGGITIMLNVTTKPETLTMEEWIYNSYSNWRHTSEITVEIPDDTDFREYLFQLGDEFSLRKVGELITASAKKLADEKNVANAVLESARLSPGRDTADETKIYIDMKPENGGTRFAFIYDLDGNLESFR